VCTGTPARAVHASEMVTPTPIYAWVVSKSRRRPPTRPLGAPGREARGAEWPLTWSCGKGLAIRTSSPPSHSSSGLVIDTGVSCHLPFNLSLALCEPTLLSFIVTLSFFFPAVMKYSLAAALLAVASASAHDFHLVERQNPSPVSSPVSSPTSLSSATPNPIPATTSQPPPSTITGGPGAIPINQVTSGMSSETPYLPTTTYPAGSRPTWDGAPPLPSPCTQFPCFYHPRCPYAPF